MIAILKLFTIMFVLSDLANFLGGLLGDIRPTFKSRLLAIIYNLVVYLLMCPRCFTMWTTLIMTGDLFTSAVVAIAVNIAKWFEYKYIKKGEREL